MEKKKFTISERKNAELSVEFLREEEELSALIII